MDVPFSCGRSWALTLALALALGRGRKAFRHGRARPDRGINLRILDCVEEMALLIHHPKVKNTEPRLFTTNASCQLCKDFANDKGQGQEENFCRITNDEHFRICLVNQNPSRPLFPFQFSVFTLIPSFFLSSLFFLFSSQQENPGIWARRLAGIGK